MQIQAFLTIIFIILLNAGCQTKEHLTLPIEKANTDGFEVIVISSTPDNEVNYVNSIHLNEAEKKVSADKSLTFNLPADTSKIVEKLRAANNQKGDFNVSLNVTEKAESIQDVALSFHYGSRTFGYHYLVDHNKITPISSSYSDSSKINETTYTK